jgi:hypothetical protein
MNKQERQNRIIARGEFSGHSHIITGKAIIRRNSSGEILIDIEGEAAIEHLIEEAWLNGNKIHTKEHAAIDLTEMPAQIRQGDIFLEKICDKTYRFIQQQVFDPLAKRIEAARD